MFRIDKSIANKLKSDYKFVNFCYTMFDKFSDLVGQMEYYGVRRLDGQCPDQMRKPVTDREKKSS